MYLSHDEAVEICKLFFVLVDAQVGTAYHDLHDGMSPIEAQKIQEVCRRRASEFWKDGQSISIG